MFGLFWRWSASFGHFCAVPSVSTSIYQCSFRVRAIGVGNMATLSLLKHLDAVTSFLNHMQGHADFSQRRHEQYVSCKQKIQNCRSIQISEGGPLLEKLSKMPWETDQSKVLQGEVAALVEGGELVDRGRRSLQNYTTFPWYLPSRIWLYILNPQEAAAALRMMTDHLIKLGLCVPSEKTCSRVTALYVLHKHHNMSAEALHQEYLNVKNYICRQIQNTAKTDGSAQGDCNTCSPAGSSVLTEIPIGAQMRSVPSL